MLAMFLFRGFLICCFFLMPLQIGANSCAALFLELHIDLGLSLNTSKILYTAGIRSVKDLQPKTEEELRKLFHSDEQALQEIKAVLNREKDQGLFSLHTVRTLNEMGIYTIDSLDLPAELVKVLYTTGIRSVGDLQSKTKEELHKLFNPGKKEQALQEINTAIKEKLASSSVSDLDLSESATNMLDVLRIYSTGDLIKRTERELLMLLNYASLHNHPSLAKDPRLVLREIKLALKKRDFRLSEDFLVNDVGLSVRVANALNTVVGIHTMEDFTKKTERELKSLLSPYASELFSHSYGEQRTFDVIKAALSERGLSLAPDPLVEDLGLTIRAANTLDKAGIHTIEDLTGKTERELKRLLRPYVSITIIDSIKRGIIPKIKAALAEKGLSLSLDPLVKDLGLSVRTANNLNRAGIHTIEDLTKKTERELKRLLRPYIPKTIYSTKGIIPKIKAVLAEKGLSLSPDPLVDDFGLSVRTANNLNKAGIFTIEDFTKKTAREILNIDDIGSQSLAQIRGVLAKKGLSFTPDPLVDGLGISIGEANNLNRVGIHTMEDLTKKTGRELLNSLLSLSFFYNYKAQDTLSDIKTALAEKGLSLKPDPLVEGLGISIGEANALNEVDIHTMEDLTKKTGRELLNIDDIYIQSLSQIRRALAKRGRALVNDHLVDSLHIPSQVATALKEIGILTIEDLTKKTGRELSKFGISSRNLDEIKNALGYRDLSLAPDPLVDDLGLSIWAANVIAKGNVFDLGLSSQTVQALNRAGIHTVEDLVRKTVIELSELDGIDSESLSEITKIFSEMGLNSS